MKRIAYGISSILCVIALLTGCGEEGTVQLTQDARKKSIMTVETKTPINVQVPISTNTNVEVKEDGNIQEFSYSLFQKSMDEMNPVLSPLSAYLALSLTGEGARGDTLEEFEQVFGGDMQSVSGDIVRGLPRDEEFLKLSLANSAWVDKRMTVDTTWVDVAKSVYQAEVYQASLPTTEAMNDINVWIDTKTEGLIPKLLEEPLEDDVRLTLFNTIYFKGEWKKKFEERDTYEREFYLEDGTTQKVEMMHQYEEYLKYVSNDVAEGVVLPYIDDENSLVFLALKPIGEQTVREMYEALTKEDIRTFLQKKGSTLCNLRLPKFEVEFEKELNGTLEDMGLKKAFDSQNADLTGLGKDDSGNNLYIDLVFQKAVVIVDEEGTEAAAVTMVMVDRESAIMEQEPPKDIFFDEPFVYMIMDVEREIPLFVGIMDNPNA